MITIVEESGVGLPNANTYVDPAGAFAEAYAAAWLYGDEWTAANADTRAQAVVSATRTLDAEFEWRGKPVRDGTQALGWPRYVRRTRTPRLGAT